MQALNQGLRLPFRLIAVPAALPNNFLGDSSVRGCSFCMGRSDTMCPSATFRSAASPVVCSGLSLPRFRLHHAPRRIPLPDGRADRLSKAPGRSMRTRILSVPHGGSAAYRRPWAPLSVEFLHGRGIVLRPGPVERMQWTALIRSDI